MATLKRIALRHAYALLLLGVLCGCSTLGDKLNPTGPSAVCTALIGPIKYNSTNRTSPRHAGSKLAPDLKARNQVGMNLGCPQYK